MSISISGTVFLSISGTVFLSISGTVFLSISGSVFLSISGSVFLSISGSVFLSISGTVKLLEENKWFSLDVQIYTLIFLNEKNLWKCKYQSVLETCDNAEVWLEPVSLFIIVKTIEKIKCK